MRKHFFFAAAAALALCFASCQKEEQRTVTHFTAGMEQAVDPNGQKIQLVGDYFHWTEGDQVTVWGDSEQGVTFNVTPREDDPTWAELGSGSVTGSHFTAIYPKILGTTPGRNQIRMLPYQRDVEGTPVGFPMYAESDNSDVFQFKNLCGALKVHVPPTNTYINGLVIGADRDISGTFDIVSDNGIPRLTNCTGGSSEVAIMNVSQAGFDLSQGRDFVFYLPPSGNDGYQLTLMFGQVSSNDEQLFCTKTCSQPIVVERSKITHIYIGTDIVLE